MQTYSDNWEVQYAQRVASNGISLLQNGQTFTVGAASVFFFPRPAALLMTFIRQNKIKAIIMKNLILLYMVIHIHLELPIMEINNLLMLGLLDVL